MKKLDDITSIGKKFRNYDLYKYSKKYDKKIVQYIYNRKIGLELIKSAFYEYCIYSDVYVIV